MQDNIDHLSPTAPGKGLAVASLVLGIIGTGNRSFYANETFVVYEAEGGEPPSASHNDRVPKNGIPIQ